MQRSGGSARHGVDLAAVELDVLGQLQNARAGSGGTGSSLHRDITPHLGAGGGIVEGRERVINRDSLVCLPIDLSDRMVS